MSFAVSLDIQIRIVAIDGVESHTHTDIYMF